MLYAASIALGIRVRLLAEGAEMSAATVVHDVTVGDYTDSDTVCAFAAGCDVIVAEEFVDFARELSALIVRSPSGQAVAYPISESVQRGGICVETVTPAPGLAAGQAVAAEQLGLQIAHDLGVVGVLAVELME